MVVAYSTIKALDVFAKEYDYNNIDEYLLGIKAELKEEPESDAPMMLLDDFASSHTKIGKMSVTVKAYVSKVKKKNT